MLSTCSTAPEDRVPVLNCRTGLSVGAQEIWTRSYQWQRRTRGNIHYSLILELCPFSPETERLRLNNTAEDFLSSNYCAQIFTHSVFRREEDAISGSGSKDQNVGKIRTKLKDWQVDPSWDFSFITEYWLQHRQESALPLLGRVYLFISFLLP